MQDVHQRPVQQHYLRHTRFVEEDAGINIQPESLDSDIALLESPMIDHPGSRIDVPAPLPGCKTVSSPWSESLITDNPSQKCACMICLHLTSERHEHMKCLANYTLVCRLPGCGCPCGSPDDDLISASIFNSSSLSSHERGHFFWSGVFNCLEKGCQKTTTKLADLKRHCCVKHCTNPTKHPCREIGCKYSGNNGFLRKDKLKTHYRNVHEGKVRPGKPLRNIQPRKNTTRGAKPGGESRIGSSE